MANPIQALMSLPADLQGVAIMMYALIGIVGAMLVFLFLIIWSTRGWLKALVKAKMRGKSLLLNLTRDKRLKLEAVENIAGMYKGKGGQYMINPESVYQSPAGVPVSVGYEHAGATLNPKHIFFLQKILREGIPMEDIVPVLDKDGNPRIGEDGKPLGEAVQYKQRIENIEELEAFAKAWKTKTGEDLFVTYDSETLCIQDILNFFKYDTNPSLMEAKIENRLTKDRMDERKLPYKMFMVMIPFMFTLVICAMILINFMNSQGSTQQLTTCQNQLGTATGELAGCRAQQKVVTGGGATAGGETSLT